MSGEKQQTLTFVTFAASISQLSHNFAFSLKNITYPSQNTGRRFVFSLKKYFKSHIFSNTHNENTN
jgi:hypothetical protein